MDSDQQVWQQLQGQQQQQQRQLEQEQQQQQQLIPHGASASYSALNYNMPLGYRFCPTDEELIIFYLRKKINKEPIPFNRIHSVSLYNYSPEQLTRKYPPDELLKENEWYFFTSRVRKYANGIRPNRSAAGGFWKPTGVERSVFSGNKTVGYKKALDYFSGHQSRGSRTNWKMHEYRIHQTGPPPNRNPNGQMNMQLDEFVLCRIYLSKRKREGDDEQDQYPGDSIMNANDDEGQAVQVNEAVVQNQNNNFVSPDPSTAPAFPWPLSYNPSNSCNNFQTFHQISSTAGFNNNVFEACMSNFAPTSSAAHVEPNYPVLADSNFSDQRMCANPIDGFVEHICSCIAGFNTNEFAATANFSPTSSAAHMQPNYPVLDGSNFSNRCMCMKPIDGDIDQISSITGFNTNTSAGTANFAPTSSAAHVEPNYPVLADSNFSVDCKYVNPIDSNIHESDVYRIVQDYKPPSDIFQEPAEGEFKDREN